MYNAHMHAQTHTNVHVRAHTHTHTHTHTHHANPPAAASSSASAAPGGPSLQPPATSALPPLAPSNSTAPAAAGDAASSSAAVSASPGGGLGNASLAGLDAQQLALMLSGLSGKVGVSKGAAEGLMEALNKGGGGAEGGGLQGGEGDECAGTGLSANVLAAVNDLSRLLVDDEPPEPAVNLSNRLNPNNVHFDKELASR